MTVGAFEISQVRERIYQEGIKKILRSYQEEMKVHKEILENTRSKLKKANHTIAMKDIELGEKPSTKKKGKYWTYKS